MSDLELKPRLQDPDAFYKSLVSAVDAAGEEGGVGVLIRLVLILANQIGDEALLEQAIAEAAATGGADREA